jgi:hypothetical protein
MIEDKKCNGPECERDIIALGLCHAHYKQFKKHGKVFELRSKHKNNTMNGLCVVDKCMRKQYSRDVCKAHYEVFRKKSRKVEKIDDASE